MAKKTRAAPTASEPPGRAFEKLTAAIQGRLDPNARVEHDVVLTDRLGQERQFDVVVRGTFGGQPMLGVIECKDIGKPVGTPAVDAFVTKASDVNANFKILVARKGFSRPALDKCAHYGIKALSLIENDPANRRFFIGTYWDADVTHWSAVSMTLHAADGDAPFGEFKTEDATIGGKRVIDWFSCFVLDHEREVTEDGWRLETAVVFDSPVEVSTAPGSSRLCAAISFRALRETRKLQYAVGLNGEGFIDWHSRQATFPPGSQIVSDWVPTDFSLWQPRDPGRAAGGFVELRFEAHATPFARPIDPIALDQLGQVLRSPEEASASSAPSAPSAPSA